MFFISPSFIGTFFASIFGAIYFVGWISDLKLWTNMTRVVILGGPAFVLLIYSFTTASIEHNKSFQEGSSGCLEYFVRIISQTLLALSLAFLGVELRVYFILFVSFTLSNIIWSIMVFNKIKDIFLHEVVNFALCVIYTIYALSLYKSAIDFERTYAEFHVDQNSYQTRLQHMQGKILDDGMALALVVGLIVMNLIILLVRNPNIREWFRRQPLPAISQRNE